MNGATGIGADHYRGGYWLAQALALARGKSAVYVRNRRLPADHREDVENELLLSCWAALSRFDPALASLRTYVSRVMENAARSMTRGDMAVRRIPDALIVSLSDSPAAADRGNSPALHLEFWLDFERAIDPLAQPLKDTAEALRWMGPAEIARVYGSSRRTVYDHIQVIRDRLVQCGIGLDYFARGGGE
jgi:RNA polymerase sigma factor (sigma-70 family)